jgi:hypothetical protein
MSKEDTKQRIPNAEDIVVERRLKTIFDLRDRIHVLRRQLRMGQISELSDFQVMCGYRTLVESYLSELNPLLLKTESGKELLENYDFGEARVRPRTVEKSRNRVLKLTDGSVPIGKTQSLPSEVARFDLIGLESLWEVPDPLPGIVTIEEVDPATMRKKQVQYNISDQIDLEPLDSMVREMNVFLSNIDLGLQPEEVKGPAEI